jgi:hypothetical protein
MTDVVALGSRTAEVMVSRWKRHRQNRFAGQRERALGKMTQRRSLFSKKKTKQNKINLMW